MQELLMCFHDDEMKGTDEMFYFEVRNDYEAIMTMALPERQLEPVASPSWSLLFPI